MSRSYFELSQPIREAYDLLERSTQSGLKGFDLSIAQFRLLETLSCGLACSPARCSEIIRLTPSGITHVIDKLERRGLVARERSESDRRLITLRLLAQGEVLYRRAACAVCEAWDRAMSANTLWPDLKILGLAPAHLKADI